MGNPSNLVRPGVYRLNIGVGKETFQRLVGSETDPTTPRSTGSFPHPVYAAQRWVSILNPSDATLRELLLPLLAEAHDRLAASRARKEAAET